MDSRRSTVHGKPQTVDRGPWTSTTLVARLRGAVVISARADGLRLRIAVEDNGRGIPADELPHVFDRFTKGVDSQGSGLGLAIARNLVVAHRGTIVARNRPQGGAAFEITVPIDANPIHDER